MKQFCSPLPILFFLLFLACNKTAHESISKRSGMPELPTDKPAARNEWERQRVEDPISHDIPKKNLLEVYRLYENNIRKKAAVVGINWTERGPNNIGGRTRAFLFDLKDPSYKTAWAASVGGGLFKCANIDSSTPVWNKVNDFFSNLAISTLVQHPTYPDTLYFGTGEGMGNADAIQGLGIWRSSDDGATWVKLPSLMPSSTPAYINRMAVTKEGIVYAATNLGLHSSSNGGNTWTRVLSTTSTPATASNTGFDVQIAANGNIYYSCNTQLWRFSKATNAWTNITPVGSFRRMEIACAPSDSNFVYLLCQGTGSSVTGFFSSNNGGSNWRSRAVPLIYDQAATAATEISRGQAWYDLALTVDPNTPTTIYAGAIDYVKSVDTGATYKQITAWSLYAMPVAANLGASQQMHSDHHKLTFRPNSSSYAIFCHDGGLSKSTNMNLVWPSVPSYTYINTNFNVTQFYSCAILNTAGSSVLLGGAQDNGSLKIASPGVGGASMPTGGDGCYTFIDQNNPNNQITSYVYNNYYRSTNGSSFGTVPGSNNTGSFVNPTELDSDNDILYSYGGTNILARWKNVFATTARNNITVSNAGIITHLKVSPNNPTTLYIGNSAGRIFRIRRADTVSAAFFADTMSSAFGGRISSIDIRKSAGGNDDTMLVTLSNYNLGNSVLYTVNGTASSPVWVDVDDNNTLPNIPINWGLIAPKHKAQEVMLATEMGIFTCDNIFEPTPTWGQSVNGLANVRVDMIKMRSADSTIVAGTHGRGMFTTDFYTAPKAEFQANKSVAYIAGSIQFSNASVKATTFEWDFDNNGSIDATTPNPTWAYGTPGYKTVKLSINSGASSITKTNIILVLPNRGVPYTLAQGGDFESNVNDFGVETPSGVAWERGNSAIANKNGVVSGANAYVTGLTAATYANDNTTYLYTPNFNLSAVAIDSIKFYLKNAFELTWDGMRVEYSLDKGTTWLPLGQTVDTNWYDYGNPSADRPFPQNQAFFNATLSSFTLKKYSLGALLGNPEVAFRFVFKSDNSANDVGCAIDNFEITSSVNTPAYLPVEAGLSNKSEMLGPNATVDFYSPNGKIMATIQNLSAHDYGLTTVEIDLNGTTPRNFYTNTANSAKIAGKTFIVNPTNNNASGAYVAKFFYTKDELGAWQAVTGKNLNMASLFKCPVSISLGTFANSVFGTSQSWQAYGYEDTGLIANFSTGFSGFALGSNNSLLPVVLTDFSAVRMIGFNRLMWTTSSELNNKLFEIERSENGKEFIKIGEELGAGTSSINHFYSFDDEQLENIVSNILYYRLKQIDFDGQFVYSSIKTLSNNLKVKNGAVFPNPAKDRITITSSSKSGFVYKVFSRQGQIVLQGSSLHAQKEILLQGIAAGAYLIEIYFEDQKDIYQFLKD